MASVDAAEQFGRPRTAAIFQDRRMAFTGETPWHTFGTKLPMRVATFEEIHAAVNFYTVLERPIFAQGIPVPLPDVKALIASDDGRYLATVGKDYGVVQFRDMAKAVVAAAGGVGAVFTTGGLLGDVGATGWLLGELPTPIEVKGGDIIRPYFLAYSGHDGRTPVTLANCATRVVCRNTVGAAMRERGGFRTSIRHTTNALSAVESAAMGFRALSASYARLGAWANLAAEKSLNRADVLNILEAAYPAPKPEEGATARIESKAERIDAIHGQILTNYERHEIPTTRGTAWALFNAVQGYAEHFAPIRGAKQLPAMTDTSRAALIAERSFFGAGADGSADALAAVLSVTGLPHPAAMGRAS